MPAPSSAVTTAGGTRPHYEVADIVRAYGATYRQQHPVRGAHEVVLRAIARCRTAALGGHVEACARCGAIRIAYNSCRNRHCPKCQGAARAKWLAAQQALLLPVEYFHIVFTLPHELNALLRVNPRRLYALLFCTAAATLQTFARDPQHLGAELGVTAVLHTWGQNLTQHVHLHCVVTGGGLSRDGRHWLNARRGFLFPVRALSKMFRGKFLAGLRRLHRGARLTFAGDSAALADTATWARWVGTLRRADWVVYAKPPFAGPERVLKYLSRYTHRVAIANERLLFVGDGVVRFRWKDYADHNRVKVMTVAADEFLRRFLLHVVPRGFMRIRHYGLLAPCHRTTRLKRCRELLSPPTAPSDFDVPHGTDRGDDTVHSPPCPACGSTAFHIIETLAPTRGIPP
jgi:hypothetical protein